MKHILFWGCLLFSLAAAALNNQSVDQLLNSGWWVDKNGSHEGNADFLPLEEQLKCKDLDELGGQPPITLTLAQAAREWADVKLPARPRYYLDKIPKRGLVEDVLLKQRQDKVLERLQELRSAIVDAYAQCLALEIEVADFENLRKKYVAVASSRYWKDLGARDGKSLIAGRWLLEQITDKCVEDVKRIYAKIIIAKTARYQAFSAAHPETAQTALAMQRARKAEQRAAVAENRARNAEMQAAAAEQAAANAAAEAEAARRDAAAANRRAADAQFRLDTGLGMP